MSSTPRPNLPPQVLEALRHGRKVEAIKLLRESGKLGLAEAKALIDRLEDKGAAAAKAASARATTIKSPPHVLPDPRRPGLSPGEVPRGGAGFGWVVLMAVGILVIAGILSR